MNQSREHVLLLLISSLIRSSSLLSKCSSKTKLNIHRKLVLYAILTIIYFFIFMTYKQKKEKMARLLFIQSLGRN